LDRINVPLELEEEEEEEEEENVIYYTKTHHVPNFRLNN